MVIVKCILRILLGIVLAIAGLFEGIDLGTNGWLTRKLMDSPEDIEEEENERNE